MKHRIFGEITETNWKKNFFLEKYKIAAKDHHYF
jgi:hypothetical protein